MHINRERDVRNRDSHLPPPCKVPIPDPSPSLSQTVARRAQQCIYEHTHACVHTCTPNTRTAKYTFQADGSLKPKRTSTPARVDEGPRGHGPPQQPSGSGTEGGRERFCLAALRPPALGCVPERLRARARPVWHEPSPSPLQSNSHVRLALGNGLRGQTHGPERQAAMTLLMPPLTFKPPHQKNNDIDSPAN